MRRREDRGPRRVRLCRRTRAMRKWKKQPRKQHLRRSTSQQSNLVPENSVQKEPQDREFHPLRPLHSPGNHRARYTKKKDNLLLHGKRRKAGLGLHSEPTGGWSKWQEKIQKLLRNSSAKKKAYALIKYVGAYEWRSRYPGSGRSALPAPEYLLNKLD